MGAWHVDAMRKYRNRSTAMETLVVHGYMTTFMRNTTTEEGSVPGEFWDDASLVGDYDPRSNGKTPWERRAVPAEIQHGATDSAAAASAMFSGYKCPRGTLNVVAREDGYPGNEPFLVRYRPTIVDFAHAAGKATGLVTSVPFNHATPAAAVVKTQYRRNQGEKARQMVYSDVDVIMGCGHPYFDQNGLAKERSDFTIWQRNDSDYLPDENGQALFDLVRNGFRARRFIDAKQDFEDLADGDGRYRNGPMPRRVFGLAPVARTLQYDRKVDDGNPRDDRQVGGQAYIPGVPDLQTMTRAALAVLERDPGGFWLMVEGGAIDWAAHANDMTRMLEEGQDFDDAVQAVIDWVNRSDNKSTWQNTLLIVTADHETGHLQPTGDVMGQAVIEAQCWGVDCNGWRDHTNSLVPIYAQGPGAEALQARFEGDCRDNTDLFKVMASALGQAGVIMPVKSDKP
jgi:alkaline phosphatase